MLQHFQLFFRIEPRLRHNVELVLRSLEIDLHFCQPMLTIVQINSYLFPRFLNIFELLLFFSQLEIPAFMLIRQLLGQGGLGPLHEVVVGWQVEHVGPVFEILAVVVVSFAHGLIIIFWLKPRNRINPFRRIGGTEIMSVGIVMGRHIVWIFVGVHEIQKSRIKI